VTFACNDLIIWKSWALSGVESAAAFAAVTSSLVSEIITQEITEIVRTEKFDMIAPNT
jgi:large-conductance mechanosensitive channel